MYELKTLSPDAVPAALEKANCYRLLKEPFEAESICLDILKIDPGNKEAFILLLLSLTEQFEIEMADSFLKAKEVWEKFEDDYRKNYYWGVICEKMAKAHMKKDMPTSAGSAYEWFQKAMEAYDTAIEKSVTGNDDAVLHWNTCARILMNHPEIHPKDHDSQEPMLE